MSNQLTSDMKPIERLINRDAAIAFGTSLDDITGTAIVCAILLGTLLVAGNG